MTAVATPTNLRPPRAGRGAQAVFVLLAAGGLVWGVTQVPQRGWEGEPQIAVTFEGEHYRVSPPDLHGLENFSTLHFGDAERAGREVVASEIGTQLDRIFMHAKQRLPEFADWYYSLRGEYSRAAMAALSFANLAEPGYVASQAAAMLLPPDVWAEDLEGLERSTAARLLAHHDEVRRGWVAEVTRRLSTHHVPAPLAVADHAAQQSRLQLDALSRDIVAREQAALQTRLSLSTLAAGGAAAGPALWRAAAARSSAAGGRTAAARAAARGAARAGPAAAGGAAICSPTGPAALGCALFAGAAVWLTTDWALLRVDEQLHREELEVALAAGLDALREQLERDLMGAYDRAVAEHYGAVQEDIQRNFVPARAGVRD